MSARAAGRPRLAVSIGCPCGIGPEVSAVAAAKCAGARVLLVGDVGAITEAVRGRGLDRSRFVVVWDAEDAWRLPRGLVGIWQPTTPLPVRDRRPGAPSAAAGAAQLAWINAACDLTARGGADAMVTGPVAKEIIARSGAPGASSFLGHTEHLQKRLRAKEVVMAFWSEKLTTALVTTHLPLVDVARAITPRGVARTTFWLARFMAALGKSPPRVAVAALNPHAGEGGLLGREEAKRIEPGIRLARERLSKGAVDATISGPVPAESAFRLAAQGAYDAVVAMYHDQAAIPMKLVGFGEAVNVSLGLPIIRTSVDHGTAYDRAGTWTADALGMTWALRLAGRMASAPSRPDRARRTA